MQIDLVAKRVVNHHTCCCLIDDSIINSIKETKVGFLQFYFHQWRWCRHVAFHLLLKGTMHQETRQAYLCGALYLDCVLNILKRE